MKRARLIYNPSAGREQIKKQLPYILDRLEKAGYETSAHQTDGKNSAKEAAHLACERKFDLVIAAGGDGTIFEVVNGIAENSYRPTLGIIPAGTTNNFAKALDIPRDIDKACDILCNGEAIPVDIGKAGHQYFVSIAAGGTLTELTYEVPIKLKTVMGQLAYYIKGLEKLPTIAPSKVRIEYDGKLFDGEIMLLLICNTNALSGFEKLAPEADVSDGMFDVLIVKKCGFPEFIKLAGLAMRGEHIHHPNVIYTQANRVKVFVEGEMQLNLDGEYGGLFPMEFVNLYQHIRVLTPKKDVSHE